MARSCDSRSRARSRARSRRRWPDGASHFLKQCCLIPVRCGRLRTFNTRDECPAGTPSELVRMTSRQPHSVIPSRDFRLIGRGGDSLIVLLTAASDATPTLRLQCLHGICSTFPHFRPVDTSILSTFQSRQHAGPDELGLRVRSGA